ncbi:MAG: hypothetical protein AAF639_35775 [Chloroflexota bacterium]
MFSLSRTYNYTHRKHGFVHYATSVSSWLTPYGTVYTTVFVPCDQKTKTIFDELNTGNARQVMPWPDVVLVEGK